MSEFSATFWGVRGGQPVPGAETVEFGGNTTCLEVRAGSHLVILDAGTGIIPLGAKLTAERRVDEQPILGTMLFTQCEQHCVGGTKYSQYVEPRP